MDQKTLKCLHDTKLLLLHAENDNWDEFAMLQRDWAGEVQGCFLSAKQEKNQSDEYQKLLKSLIEDVDQVCSRIKRKMDSIEQNFSQNRQSHDAVGQYLK